MNDFERISATIASSGPWHVAILEYGLTHSQMRLAMHRGNFPVYKELVLRDVQSVIADVFGGPYELSIVEAPDECWEIVSSDRRFMVRFRQMVAGPGVDKSGTGGNPW